VEKGYVALVYGRLAEERGQWEAPIGSDPEATPRWGIRETGRPAATRFAVCERFPAHTLLDLEPVTGRTNQLRLHCAHFGHPIVGDELFGQGEEAELGRLFLHAASLRFRHPMDGELRRFEAPLPAVLRAFLDRCRSG